MGECCKLFSCESLGGFMDSKDSPNLPLVWMTEFKFLLLLWEHNHIMIFDQYVSNHIVHNQSKSVTWHLKWNTTVILLEWLLQATTTNRYDANLHWSLEANRWLLSFLVDFNCLKSIFWCLFFRKYTSALVTVRVPLSLTPLQLMFTMTQVYLSSEERTVYLWVNLQNFTCFHLSV